MSSALACLLSCFFDNLVVLVVSVVVVAVVLAAAAATAAAAAAAAAAPAAAVSAAAVAVVVVVVLVFSLLLVLLLTSLPLSLSFLLLLLLLVLLMPHLSRRRLLFVGFVFIPAAHLKGPTAADLNFDITAFLFWVSSEGFAVVCMVAAVAFFSRVVALIILVATASAAVDVAVLGFTLLS